MRTTGALILKIVRIIIIAFISFLVLAFLAFYVMMGNAIASNYDDIERADDGFDYLVRYHNKNNKKAGVCEYTNDPDSGISEITIPEMYGDYPVKALGGYIGKGGPSPFGIQVKGFGTNMVVDPDDASAVGVDKITCYDLVLNIGPNIREVITYRACYFKGSKGYVVRLYVNCDPDNPKFYSENGRLYTKSGKLVEDLVYWDEVFD